MEAAAAREPLDPALTLRTAAGDPITPAELARETALLLFLPALPDRSGNPFLHPFVTAVAPRGRQLPVVIVVPALTDAGAQTLPWLRVVVDPSLTLARHLGALPLPAAVLLDGDLDRAATVIREECAIVAALQRLLGESRARHRDSGAMELNGLG